MIAIRGLELYYSWGLILFTVSAILFGMALVFHVSARSYILECQLQVHRLQHDNGTTESGPSYSLSHAGKLLAWLEDISLVLLYFPPLVMGAVVLWVSR
jgi:hypothetical protein